MFATHETKINQKSKKKISLSFSRIRQTHRKHTFAKKQDKKKPISDVI